MTTTPASTIGQLPLFVWLIGTIRPLGARFASRRTLRHPARIGHEFRPLGGSAYFSNGLEST
jgi:hypothetical protein